MIAAGGHELGHEMLKRFSQICAHCHGGPSNFFASPNNYYWKAKLIKRAQMIRAGEDTLIA
jgi:hypothetical protein